MGALAERGWKLMPVMEVYGHKLGMVVGCGKVDGGGSGGDGGKRSREVIATTTTETPSSGTAFHLAFSKLFIL